METQRKKLGLILVVAGILVSLYLTYIKVSADPYLCDFGQCGVVQASSYSTLFGIPVALWGTGYYLMLGLAVLKGNRKILDLALAWGIAFSTYLTYIEIFVLKAVCGWCVVSFVIILMISALHFIPSKRRTSLQ